MWYRYLINRCFKVDTVIFEIHHVMFSKQAIFIDLQINIRYHIMLIPSKRNFPKSHIKLSTQVDQPWSFMENHPGLVHHSWMAMPSGAALPEMKLSILVRQMGPEIAEITYYSYRDASLGPALGLKKLSKIFKRRVTHRILA